VFYTYVTPEWAQNTTHRLFLDTVPSVITAKGDYPSKRYR
jgi:hypothetical protein